MKNLKVTVNGTSYDVQVEEVEGFAAKAAPAVAPAPVPAAAPAQAAEIVESPMQGSIGTVTVAAGQTVRQNDSLLTMKTAQGEIELVAPRAATVAEVYVAQGANVEAGTALVSLR